MLRARADRILRQNTEFGTIEDKTQMAPAHTRKTLMTMNDMTTNKGRLNALKALIEDLSSILESYRRALAFRDKVIDAIRRDICENQMATDSPLSHEYEKARQELDRLEVNLLRATAERTRAQQELALRSVDLTNLKKRYEREKTSGEMTFGMNTRTKDS